jgi:hypothetical protein
MKRIFRFGACFVGKSITQARFDSVPDKRVIGASSPFCKLIISDSTISLQFFKRTESISYADLDRVFISKTGYINFHSEKTSFGFSHPALHDIAKELTYRGIRVDKDNIKSGSFLIYLQIAFALVLSILCIISFI